MDTLCLEFISRFLLHVALFLEVDSNTGSAWKLEYGCRCSNAVHSQRQTLHLFHNLGCRRQILIAILCNMDVVLDADTADAPVSFQNIGIDILAGLGRLNVRLNDEAAEVNLRFTCQ